MIQKSVKRVSNSPLSRSGGIEARQNALSYFSSLIEDIRLSRNGISNLIADDAKRVYPAFRRFEYSPLKKHNNKTNFSRELFRSLSTGLYLSLFSSQRASGLNSNTNLLNFSLADKFYSQLFKTYKGFINYKQVSPKIYKMLKNNNHFLVDYFFFRASDNAASYVFNFSTKKFNTLDFCKLFFSSKKSKRIPSFLSEFLLSTNSLFFGKLDSTAEDGRLLEARSRAALIFLKYFFCSVKKKIKKYLLHRRNKNWADCGLAYLIGRLFSSAKSALFNAILFRHSFLKKFITPSSLIKLAGKKKYDFTYNFFQSAAMVANTSYFSAPYLGCMPNEAKSLFDFYDFEEFDRKNNIGAAAIIQSNRLTTENDLS